VETTREGQFDQSSPHFASNNRLSAFDLSNSQAIQNVGPSRQLFFIPRLTQAPLSIDPS